MERYDRHLKLLGENNFQKIQQATIGVIGTGGLGSTVLQLLVRMGFGTIHHWDYAILDAPDLNRQLLYEMSDIGRKKVDAANDRLKQINPEIQIFSHHERLDKNSNVPKLDLVIDCLDNFKSRFVLDFLFFDKGTAIIHAGVFRYSGQLTSLIPKLTKNYQQTFALSQDIEEKEEKEIFPPIVTSLASMQVNEAVKFILNDFDNMFVNKLLLVDLYFNTFDIIKLN